MRRKRRVSGRPAPATRAAPLIRGRVRCGAVAVAVAGGGRGCGGCVVYSVVGSGAPSAAVAKGRIAPMPRTPTEIESRLTWRHLGVCGAPPE